MGALFLIPLINFMILIFLTRISPAPIHHIQESIAHDHYRANLGTAIAYESFHRNARRWPFIQVSPSRSGNNYYFSNKNQHTSEKSDQEVAQVRSFVSYQYACLVFFFYRLFLRAKLPRLLQTTLALLINILDLQVTPSTSQHDATSSFLPHQLR